MSKGRDQFYLFTMPGDICPVWAEVFLPDGTHHVAPTPYTYVDGAMEGLKNLHPEAIVDELDLDSDIAECREWARTMPLEQIPA